MHYSCRSNDQIGSVEPRGHASASNESNFSLFGGLHMADNTATALITGGTSGIGLATANSSRLHRAFSVTDPTRTQPLLFTSANSHISRVTPKFVEFFGGAHLDGGMGPIRGEQGNTFHLRSVLVMLIRTSPQRRNICYFRGVDPIDRLGFMKRAGEVSSPRSKQP